MQDLLIKNGKVLIYTEKDVVLEQKDILVQNGKITKVDKNLDVNIISAKQNENSKKQHEHTQAINKMSKDEEKNNIKVIDATGHIIMPGLINTHAHIPMSIFRETVDGLLLQAWLQDKIWPMEDKLTKKDIYYKFRDKGNKEFFFQDKNSFDKGFFLYFLIISLLYLLRSIFTASLSFCVVISR